MKGGKWSHKNWNKDSSEEVVLLGWVEKRPNLKRIIEGGKLAIDCMNLSPNSKWVSEGGKLSTDWLKESPNVKWVIEEGKLSTL